MRKTLRRISISALRVPLIRSATIASAELMDEMSGKAHAYLTLEAAERECNAHSHDGSAVSLELLGPSGVGKSTLGSAMVSDWDLNQKLLKFGGLIPSQRVLRRLPPARLAMPCDQLNLGYVELLRHQTAGIFGDGQTSVGAVTHLRLFSDVMNQDLRIRMFAPKCIVVRDEGLLHHFGSAIRVGLQDMTMHELLKRRIVIHLFAPDSVIDQRARKRVCQTLGHRSRATDRSVNNSKEQLSRNALVTEFANNLRHNGVPVLSLDSRSPVSENLEAIRDFLPRAAAELRSECNGSERR